MSDLLVCPKCKRISAEWLGWTWRCLWLDCSWSSYFDSGEPYLEYGDWDIPAHAERVR